MNLKNLGTPLSRDEQKQIKGGVPQCDAGLYVKCTLCPCVENTVADTRSPAQICTATGCGTPVQEVCYEDSLCTIP
jgi:hypothetical protein